jgi:hypothetical protein
VFVEELEQALKMVAVLPGAATPYARSPIPDVRRVYLSQSGAKATVQFRTADVGAGGYTRFMAAENLKTVLFVAWVIAVCVAAIVIGVTSVANWIVVACAAIVPALIVRRFWRAPEQTISESIHDASR